MTSKCKQARRRNAIAATLATAILVAACSSIDDSSQDQPAPEPTTTAVASAAVDVVAIDYAYVGLPSEIDAGTTIRLTNESGSELHEFVAIRLPDDEARPVAELMQLPPDELAAFFPLVETVILAPPGAEGFAVEGTGVLTEPGRYAIICAIPTGADPDEYMAAAAESEGGPPEVAGGPPHIAHGMFAEVVVNG
jgi:plastocyanin